ncbi:hypothetical protein CI1B_32620 [Bradyrhizobium ivorense]|uniref:Uncharacterized protein n=1 Tax=Bradyrhizobium ivorense TaxID=2511166 RepID=A0A508TCT6_9BRAD|nr:hypothetical protein CI1B_32620 [Bradyrhizobium ivorense]
MYLPNRHCAQWPPVDRHARVRSPCPTLQVAIVETGERADLSRVGRIFCQSVVVGSHNVNGGVCTIEQVPIKPGERQSVPIGQYQCEDSQIGGQQKVSGEARNEQCLTIARRTACRALSRSRPALIPPRNEVHSPFSSTVQSAGREASDKCAAKAPMPGTPCAAEAPLPSMMIGVKLSACCANSCAISNSLFAVMLARNHTDEAALSVRESCCARRACLV